MLETGYRQFCPVAIASDILSARWTLLVVRELLAGSTRFNQLRMGVPRMSPALLTKRLRQLEQAGIVQRERNREPPVWEYRLTSAGQDLRRVVDTVGAWGQRWIDARISLENPDPAPLMWDMRRNLRPRPLPPARCVIHFVFPELQAARRSYWLVVEPDGQVELHASDLGIEVDLYVKTDLRTMAAVWTGLTTLTQELKARKVTLKGAPRLATSVHRWLGERAASKLADFVPAKTGIHFLLTSMRGNDN